MSATAMDFNEMLSNMELQIRDKINKDLAHLLNNHKELPFAPELTINEFKEKTHIPSLGVFFIMNSTNREAVDLWTLETRWHLPRFEYPYNQSTEALDVLVARDVEKIGSAVCTLVHPHMTSEFKKIYWVKNIHFAQQADCLYMQVSLFMNLER